MPHRQADDARFGDDLGVQAGESAGKPEEGDVGAASRSASASPPHSKRLGSTRTPGWRRVNSARARWSARPAPLANEADAQQAGRAGPVSLGVA